MTRRRPVALPPGHAGAVALPWLPAMGLPTVEAALRDATSTKVRFRRDAAFVLGTARGDAAGPATAALRRLADDADAVVRALAVESLAQQRGEGAQETATRLVDDPDEGVRRAAVEAVGMLAGDDPTPLARLLDHERPDVRARACACLGDLGSAAAEDLLVRALGDAEPSVRAAAAAALGVGCPRRAAELRRALTDADAGVRLAAAAALARLRDDAGHDVLADCLRAGPQGDELDEVLALLGRVGRAEDRAVFGRYARWPTRWSRRAIALAALARLGDGDARGRLRRMVDHRDPRRRGHALLAAALVRVDGFLADVERELGHPESPLFETALAAVVEYADPSATPTLVRAARETADRAVFEALAAAAGDLARLLGDDAPHELLALGAGGFEAGDAAAGGGQTREPADG